jgi:hypothetical protein
MAIIRSKIARQLLAEGGAPRKGFARGSTGFEGSPEMGGSRADTSSFSGPVDTGDFGSESENIQQNFLAGMTPSGRGDVDNIPTYDTGPGRTTRNFMKAFSFLQNPFFGIGANRAINNELAREQMLANARLSGSFMLPNQLPMRMTRTNTNRFNNEDDSSDNIVLPILPKVPKLPSDIEPEQSDMAEFIANIRGANPTAFDISERFRLAEGGEPRQEYGLGSIVKKITGTVKKVAKSPIGKAALAVGLGAYGLGAGPFAKGSTMFGGKLAELAGSGFLKNLGIGAAFDAIPGGGVTASIVGASLLGGLLTSKQPEQDINALSQRISDQTGIDVAKIRGEVQQAYQNKDTSSLAQKYPFLVDQEYSASFSEGGDVKEVEKEKPMTPEEYFKGKQKFNKKKMLEDMEDEYREYLNRQKYGPRNEAANGGDIENAPRKEGIMMASNIENEKILEDLFEKYLDMGLSPKEAADKAMEEFDRMSMKGDMSRTMAAEGGMMDLDGNEMDLRGGGFVPIGVAEKADDVPARLSKNEFVFTADAVRAAGGGSVDRGADLMYKTMKQLENKVV